jgi:hypothetical protein
MKNTSRILASFAAVFLALAWTGNVRAEDPATFQVSVFTFTRPAGWDWVEVTSPMRKAQLRVKDTDGKTTADVVFSHFGPGPAGGTQANIERWFRQFGGDRDKINAKTEEVTVGKTKVTYAQAEGTFQSGMPGGPLTPMDDYALLGAIIESDDGAVFVKMTGPKTLVKTSTAEFKKMVEGALKKD